jgi:hypothetical protein
VAFKTLSAKLEKNLVQHHHATTTWPIVYGNQGFMGLVANTLNNIDNQ